MSRPNLDLPDPLRQTLAEAVEGVPFGMLATEAQRLRDGYRAERVEATPRLDSDLAALAYAASRMPGTYAAVRAVLAQAVETVPDLSPLRVADIGGGTGAGAWAAAEAWPALEVVTTEDMSAAARALGGHLARARTAPPSFQWEPIEQRADVVMAAYLLGELTAEQRVDLVERMTGLADTVVVVEPGTTVGYKRILAARQQMIDAGLSIAAPCPHDGTCPLAQDDWCHFAARFNRSATLRRLKDAERGHDDEKFSYVIATRHPVSRARGRIIRHPQKRTGLVTLKVCAEDGVARPVTVTKRHGEDYRAARDVRWGDAWPG